MNMVPKEFMTLGAAHNVLQLGVDNPSGEIKWIEPVEVWGAFRAGRKAQPRHRESGYLSDDFCFAAGSHDGFDRYGASHKRRVELHDANADHVLLIVEDVVSTRRLLFFRQWWHLAPGVPKACMGALSLEAPTAKRLLLVGTPLGFRKVSDNAHRAPASALAVDFHQVIINCVLFSVSADFIPLVSHAPSLAD